MKSKIRMVLIVLALLIMINFTGCVIRPTPYEDFISLQELKDSMINEPYIYFPDTTRHIFVDTVKFQKVYKGKSNILEGYSFGGDLKVDQSDTNLTRIYFTCEILEVAYDDRNPAPSISPNTKVLGFNVYEKLDNQSENPYYLASGRYEEGTKIMSYSYQFDLRECRYTVSGSLVIPPDRLNNLDGQEVEAMVESSKNEVIYLVESIIKQEDKGNEKISN